MNIDNFDINIIFKYLLNFMKIETTKLIIKKLQNYNNLDFYFSKKFIKYYSNKFIKFHINRKNYDLNDLIKAQSDVIKITDEIEDDIEDNIERQENILQSLEGYCSPCGDLELEMLKQTCHPLTSYKTSSFEKAKAIRTPYDKHWLMIYNGLSLSPNVIFV